MELRRKHCKKKRKANSWKNYQNSHKIWGEFQIQQQKKQSMKKLFDKLEFIKIKILSSAKDTVENEKTSRKRKKTLAKDLSDKECYPKYTKYS